MQLQLYVSALCESRVEYIPPAETKKVCEEKFLKNQPRGKIKMPHERSNRKKKEKKLCACFSSKDQKNTQSVAGLTFQQREKKEENVTI